MIHRKLDEVITVPLSLSLLPARSINVIVFPSSTGEGKWILKCNVEARDVESEEGRPGDFATEHTISHSLPTWKDVRDVIVAQLTHEIEEQLGLDPHNLRKDSNGREP